MKVKFKLPFYHATRGLMPRKTDMIGQVIEIDNGLITELPLTGVEIIEADSGIRKVYAKRIAAKQESTRLAKATSDLKEAKKQTDLLITLINSLKSPGKPTAQKAEVADEVEAE